ncbi:MAG: chalcone isomerase family protein [Pseudomonadota bacterium]
MFFIGNKLNHTHASGSARWKSTQRLARPLPVVLIGSLVLAATTQLLNAAESADRTSSGQYSETSQAEATPLNLPTEAELQMVGEARLKVLLWSIYDSRLYTPSGEYEDGDRPLRLEIEYLRDIKGKALVDRTQQEWEAMGRSHPRQQDWLASLADMWPDIEEDDVLAFDLSADGSATFSRNGEVLGAIEDAAFGQQFIDIWVSKDCTRPKLRLDLLGLDG